MKKYFVVQSFTRQKRGALTPDRQVAARDEGHARRLAEKAGAIKAGAFAFSAFVDEETGESEGLVLIVKHGDIPADVLDAL
jgi:hypothetical protein